MLCEDQTDQQTCNNAGCDWTDPVPSSQTRFVSCVDDSTGLTVDDQYCADALITADVMPDTDNDGVPDDQRVCGVCPEGTTGTYPDCTQNPVADMCDNIDGTQSTMPSHMVQDGDSCVCSDGYRMTGDGICVFDGSAYKCHSAAWIPTISPCLTSTYNPNISYAEGDVVCSTTTPSTLNCLYNPQ
ncbi:MAG: hypothetical protein H6766_01250 [Candidatus Peribacteria bacterium]|nr:MAG: hypothetical protein H6766_01250 [Candidatus Peribacteria bacterium]